MTDTTLRPAWLVDYLNDDGTIDPQMPLCAAGNALLDYHVRRDEFGPEGPDGAAVEAIRQEAEVAARAAISVERERIQRSLTMAMLRAFRSIPDGEIRDGCVVMDGGQVRERLRAAYKAITEDPA